MSSLDLTVEVDGDAAIVQKVRLALYNREELHQQLAGAHEGLTREYVKNLDRHKTANRLGAKPTKHYEKHAKNIEGDADAEAAYLRIPRNSGLGRAFYDFELVPGAGKKYLTIPAHAITYGKSAGEFGEAFNFVSFGGKHFALVWKDGRFKGEIAYWLKKRIHIDQDRELLPSEEALLKLSKRVITGYVQSLASD